MIDQAAGVWTGPHNSVVVEDAPNAGRIHVAYQEFSNKDLRYARKDPGESWVRRTVDFAGSVGSHTSIALDTFGQVHIAYHDEATRDLKIASGTP